MKARQIIEMEDPKSALRMARAAAEEDRKHRQVRLSMFSHPALRNIPNEVYDGIEIAPIVDRDGAEDRAEPGEDISNATWWLFAHIEGGGLVDIKGYPTLDQAERAAIEIRQLTKLSYFVDFDV